MGTRAQHPLSAAEKGEIMLFLNDEDLINKYISDEKPLPFSLSSMRKDRRDGRLGIPYRIFGESFFYCPDDINKWLGGIPIVIPKPKSNFSKTPHKKGRPSIKEQMEAEKRGITVKELRS